MDIQRERSATTATVIRPGSPVTPDEPVPMLQFFAGACRAVAALARFCAEVVRERTADPITIEPRILRS